MSNPYLDTTLQPNWVAMTPEVLPAALEQGLADAQANISHLEGLVEKTNSTLSYAETFAAFEKITDSLDTAWSRANHLDSVDDSEARREVMNQWLPKISQFYTGIVLNSKLWELLKNYAENSDEALSAIQQRYKDEVVTSFTLAGANLAETEKLELKALSEKLSLTTKQFSENVLDSTNAWEHVVTQVSELDGLPDMAIEQARLDALAKDYGSEEEPQWRFTLQATSMIPVLEYAHNEALRKTIWQGSSEVAAVEPYDNQALIIEILELRQAKAELLGFADFSDVTTCQRMAKSGEQALNFVHSLQEKVNDQQKDEFKALHDFKVSDLEKKSVDSAVAKAPFTPWETGYWALKQLEATHDFNPDDLRPYFAVDKVMQGVFAISERVFNVSFKEQETTTDPEANPHAVAVWHEEVKSYELIDNSTQHTLGYFYTDWHPRESKRSGAWMNGLWDGNPKQNKPHLAVISGNMTKPTADQAALLTHDEVQTIFHEFGHLLHQLLSEVEIESLTGTSVAWDFVELPSQLMENFCWDKTSLGLFAQHHETGELIPDDLFDKMIASRNHNSALGFMRQLNYGRVDLELHRHLDAVKDLGVEGFYREILQDYLVEIEPQPPSILARFSHLFSSSTGYAAGYYSYKWAEVLDADAFEHFAENGVLSTEIGMKFRSEILAKGNSQDADQLYRNFRGRDADQKSLLTRSGIN